jgi:hypothetical protein
MSMHVEDRAVKTLSLPVGQEYAWEKMGAHCKANKLRLQWCLSSAVAVFSLEGAAMNAGDCWACRQAPQHGTLGFVLLSK